MLKLICTMCMSILCVVGFITSGSYGDDLSPFLNLTPIVAPEQSFDLIPIKPSSPVVQNVAVAEDCKCTVCKCGQKAESKQPMQAQACENGSCQSSTQKSSGSSVKVFRRFGRLFR